MVVPLYDDEGNAIWRDEDDMNEFDHLVELWPHDQDYDSSASVQLETPGQRETYQVWIQHKLDTLIWFVNHLTEPSWGTIRLVPVLNDRLESLINRYTMDGRRRMPQTEWWEPTLEAMEQLHQQLAPWKAQVPRDVWDCRPTEWTDTGHQRIAIDKDELAWWFEGGLTNAFVAKLWGIGMATLFTRKRESGLSRPQRRRARTPTIIDELGLDFDDENHFDLSLFRLLKHWRLGEHAQSTLHQIDGALAQEGIYTWPGHISIILERVEASIAAERLARAD
ncbi:hypothetical protein ACM66B_002386 [Microbotryomycetes sp. NB124-2]